MARPLPYLTRPSSLICCFFFLKYLNSIFHFFVGNNNIITIITNGHATFLFLIFNDLRLHTNKDLTEYREFSLIIDAYACILHNYCSVCTSSDYLEKLLRTIHYLYIGMKELIKK